MHDLALDRRHRLELDRRCRRDRPLGAALRRARRASPAAGPGSRQRRRRPLALVAAAAPDDRVREVLDRVDRLAVLADQRGRGRGRRRSRRASRRPPRARSAARTPSASRMRSSELAHVGGLLALVAGSRSGAAGRRGRRRSAITRAGAKPTPSRPRSPSETTWKRTAALSSPGLELLELPQRRPLRLADGLAGGLDLRAPRSRSSPRRPSSCASPSARLRGRCGGRRRRASVVRAVAGRAARPSAACATSARSRRPRASASAAA